MSNQELTNPIIAKISRGPNVKNELEQDLKDPSKTRRWNLDIPIYTPKDKDGKDQPQKFISVGVPDPRELQCFIDNNYEYHSHQYRVWRNFLQETQRNPHTVLSKMIKRGRVIERGIVKDVYLVQVEIRGTNNKERRQQVRLELGKYDTVTFLKNTDPQSGDLYAVATDQFIPHYEFIFDAKDPESVKALKYWVDHADTDILFYCVPSLRGSEILPIMDLETFINATFAELLECGRRGILLPELRDMKAYYVAMQMGKNQPTAVTTTTKSKATVETK